MRRTLAGAGLIAAGWAVAWALTPASAYPMTAGEYGQRLTALAAAGLPAVLIAAAADALLPARPWARAAAWSLTIAAACWLCLLGAWLGLTGQLFFCGGTGDQSCRSSPATRAVLLAATLALWCTLPVFQALFAAWRARRVH